MMSRIFYGILKHMEPIESQEKTREKTTAQSFWELVRFALIALIIVIPIRLFIAEPFVVSGNSMVPTFENGDYLIVDKISYELGNIKRNDVAVFRYPNDPVDIKGSEVTITNRESEESFTLDQPFVKNFANNNTHLELKDDEYFVMGDNRSASSDSRYWGAVKRNFLQGKAFLRLLPVNQIDFWPGSYKPNNK